MKYSSIGSVGMQFIAPVRPEMMGAMNCTSTFPDKESYNVVTSIAQMMCDAHEETTGRKTE
ncbi:MAG TPA: hypothetical protein DHW02_05310 [Ktedonobacter sp.]|nr:hypothetical protein [Ktedonobacter sp.]